MYLLAFLLVTNVLIAEDLSFQYIHEEFKKGNYETVARLSHKVLKSPDPTKDPRFFFLYISTEKNWGALKALVASQNHPTWKESTFYWNAIYLFMERALVLGESDLLVKYGRNFQKDGKASPRYLDAIFLLAFGLFDLKNFSEGIRVIEILEKQDLSPKLKNQIDELKIEFKDAGKE